MFGFGKKKEDDDDLFGSDGEGKFPPAENAFDEHTPLSETPRPAPGMAMPLENTGVQNPFKSEAIEESRFDQPVPIQQQPNQMNQPTSNSTDKIEIVIAKIDSLKSNIEVLNQRMISLEHKLAQQDRRW